MKPAQSVPEVSFVTSSLGFSIKILAVGWQYILTKHQNLDSKFSLLAPTLETPDAVRRDPNFSEVVYYYKKFRGKYLRLVCKHYQDRTGFLVTAHWMAKIRGENL